MKNISRGKIKKIHTKNIGRGGRSSREGSGRQEDAEREDGMQRCILLFIYFFLRHMRFFRGQHAAVHSFFFVRAHMPFKRRHSKKINRRKRRCILLHHLAESKSVASSLLTRLRVAATAGVQGLC